MNYNEARDIIIDRVKPVSSEKIALSESGGRISAQNITAKINVPPFDRSPYDGYAFIAENTPAKLQIIEEISAGSVPSFPVKSGQAAKIMTGAIIPEGADSVIPYEDTEFTDSEVVINQACKSGKNIIRAGEDVKIGDTLLHAGDFIDAGRAGLAASQGITQLEVYRQPVIGLISTGSELQEAGELQEGKIYNTSRYSFESALKLSGFTPKFIGITKDDENEIAGMINNALSSCDALIITGGVSAGDYDRMPQSLEISGAEIIVRDVELKPGGKCIYAIKNEKLICCLSGNPASALTNYYAVALPAMKKLAGIRDFIPVEFDVTLANPFNKRSPKTRIIRGVLEIIEGRAVINVPPEQGNGVLQTMTGCNVMAVVPAGSDKLPEGTRLKGFII